MLGPHWSREELERFYAAYREHETDWRKVAAVLRNRSVEMVEAVYSLNKAYLSLPEGTASVVGFIAMMTDYYSNMEERDIEQERNDGVGTSRKPKKRVPRKVQKSTSKGSVDRFGLHPEAVPSDYGCLPLLKKKRSGGSRPRVVGKRTPRFLVSHSHENVKGEYFVPTSKGLKLKLDNEEDDASERGGSPNRKSNSLMSSPSQSAERMYDEDVASVRSVDNDDDIEGSMEADNTDFSRDKSKERTNAGYMLHSRKGSEERKVRLDKKGNKHLDYIREACSGTEGQYLGTLRRNFDVEVADVKPSGPSSQVSKKRSKEAFARRDERSTFDALETLASLSLLGLPDSNEKEKDEFVADSNPLQATPAIRQGEERKSVDLRGKGNQSFSRLEASDSKALTSGKHLVDDIYAASETKVSHQLITKVSRKRQKIVAPKISKEAHIDTTPKDSRAAEATHAVRMSMSRHISQSSSPQFVKPGQYVSSDIHSSRKVRSKRKMYKPEAFEFFKFSDAVGTDKSGVHLPTFSHRTVKPKVKLSSCLSNQLMRRWCAFEWFYSVIDDPWFSKREFAEYLYHVGLGHVPRLTRVEWGVIRSSLGKPRRFSVQFLKEENHKLNQYRDSVRTHYTELRSGSRDGLPTDLARPLSVGQRVIAIYPRTREIHDGTVLTVDHDRCRVQFDRPELGAEIIMVNTVSFFNISYTLYTITHMNELSNCLALLE
ncbi:protein ALWAYS EARLY 3 isoform X2 [Tanacetum coccineum]